MDPRPNEVTATATAPAPARNGNRSDPGIRSGAPRSDPGGWISIGGLRLEPDPAPEALVAPGVPDPAVSGEVLARGEGGMKFGRRAVATGGGIALGHGAVATGGGIALGHGASAGDGSVTIGGGVSIVGGGVSVVGGAPPARSGLGGGPRGGGE